MHFDLVNTIHWCNCTEFQGISTSNESVNLKGIECNQLFCLFQPLCGQELSVESLDETKELS